MRGGVGGLRGGGAASAGGFPSCGLAPLRCKMPTVQESGSDYARPGGLQAQRRHHPAQRSQSGLLGQEAAHPLVAVPARRHQARRDARAGDVPRAARGGRPQARACADPRPHARLAALRGAAALHPARRARPLPRPEADLVPAEAGRPRQRHEPARHRPPRVRRLALERLLGAAGRGDRVQARRLRDGADRAVALPPARRAPQPLPACRHARPAAWRAGGRAAPRR